MPKEKYSFVTEIFEHSQRIGRHYGLYEQHLFQTRVRSIDWDDDIKRWHITHQPRRRHQGALRRHGARHGHPGQAARHPGHRRVRGPLLPHQPLGLRLHRRRHERRA